MRHDLLFVTDRFNLSEVKPHFINPCCFGEDAAAWLRARLAERGVEASAPDQEDWGWYLTLEHGRHAYLIGVGGNADDPDGGGNRGEWRVIVERRRSLRERLAGAAPMTADDPVFTLVRSILEAEPGFSDVRVDEGA